MEEGANRVSVGLGDEEHIESMASCAGVGKQYAILSSHYNSTCNSCTVRYHCQGVVIDVRVHGPLSMTARPQLGRTSA